jgi:acyl homoserine lactone synthase
MLYLVPPQLQPEFRAEIDAMHRLRHRVFFERLGWDVAVRDGMEFDEYDDMAPTYLLHRAGDGRVDGCVRLLPSLGPNMLRDTFPQLLDGGAAPCDDRVWESSRFALDLGHDGDGKAISFSTARLFAGMLEFGLSRGLAAIATVTDLRVERILRRSGWTLERLGAPREIGNTTAVAGLLPVSWENLAQVRRRGDLPGPVLWMPAIERPLPIAA